ncbi:hypothetical protein RUND412_004246 [Rhizina undulata]
MMQGNDLPEHYMLNPALPYLVLALTLPTCLLLSVRLLLSVFVWVLWFKVLLPEFQFPLFVLPEFVFPLSVFVFPLSRTSLPQLSTFEPVTLVPNIVNWLLWMNWSVRVENIVLVTDWQAFK